MGRLINSLKCRLIQKTVYKKVYSGHKPNEWKPWKEPGRFVLGNGIVCQNDVQYAAEYPNSFADIWYPDDTGARRPVFIYFHGGGFLFGDKSSGDPLAVDGGGTGFLNEVVKAGYIIVNANYCLAPEYQFPVQLKQADQLFAYLLKHQEELSLDMSRVCLSGSSAGANITEMYATCVCNRDYAKMWNIAPSLNEEKIRVLAVDEAALDASVFDDNMFAMMEGVSGASRKQMKEGLDAMNAKLYITDHYIPSWLNASNEPNDERGFFITEARGMEKKLKEIGCDVHLTFFPNAKLPHGYMSQLGKEEHADQAFKEMMAFVEKHIR